MDIEMGKMEGTSPAEKSTSKYTDATPADVEDAADKKDVIKSLLDVFLEATVDATGSGDIEVGSPQMTHKLLEDIESFLIQLSTCYQAYGCPTHTIEMTMVKVAKGLGVEAQFLVFPSHTIIEISNIKTASGLMKRHSQFYRTSGGYNFYKLQLVDELARRISSYAEDANASGVKPGQGVSEDVVQEAFERARAYSGTVAVQNRENRAQSGVLEEATSSAKGSVKASIKLEDCKINDALESRPGEINLPPLDSLKMDSPQAPFHSLLPRLLRRKSQASGTLHGYAQSLGKVILDLARLGPNVYAADRPHSSDGLHVSAKSANTYRHVFSKLAVEDGIALIRAIVKLKPLYSMHYKCFLLAVSAFGCAGIFFGGNWTDMWVSFVLGWLVAYIEQISTFSPSFARIYEFVATFIASIIIRALNQHWTPLCYRAVLMSAIIFSLQGFTITMSFIDLMTKDLVAGTTKLFYGMLISAIIGFAMDVSTSTYATFSHRSYEDVIGDSSCSASRGIDPNYYPPLFVVTTFAFNVLIEAHNNQLVPMIMISAVCYLVYYYASDYMTSELPVILAAFAASCLSNLYCRFTGHPAIVYIIPAVFLLVPGSIAASSFFTVFTMDFNDGLNLTFSVVTGALAIAIGVFGASTVVQVPDVEEVFLKVNSLYPGPKSKNELFQKRKSHRNSALAF